MFFLMPSNDLLDTAGQIWQKLLKRKPSNCQIFFLTAGFPQHDEDIPPPLPERTPESFIVLGEENELQQLGKCSIGIWGQIQLFSIAWRFLLSRKFLKKSVSFYS